MKKDYLLGEINEKIKKYDLQLEDFFEEVKNEENSERKNIFESKEKFFSYINDIFSSTFKITKYEDKNFEENIRERGNYKKVLALSKEYLIAYKEFNWDLKKLKKTNLEAIKFSFSSEEIKDKLIKIINSSY